MRDIDKYVGDCLSINFEPKQNRFKIFTCPTQHFYVDLLSELTPEKFELQIKKQKEVQEQTLKNFQEVYSYWENKNR